MVSVICTCYNILQVMLLLLFDIVFMLLLLFDIVY